MAAHNLDAYLIPSGDEHLNEYVPDAKQRRAWASGFTGSAGDFLVGKTQAWVFVDSRYYEQADLEVDPHLIQICKLEIEGHKTLTETLEAWGNSAQQTVRVGYDPFTLSVFQWRSLNDKLKSAGIELVAIADNLVDLAQRQPELQPTEPHPYAESSIFQVPDAIAGQSSVEKLQAVREALATQKADILPLTKLDQIAWLFNLRGWDVPYNPVFIAYAIVTADHAYLFTNLERLDASIQQELQAWVTLRPYTDYAATLQQLASTGQMANVLIDPKQATMGTHQLVERLEHAQILEATHPIEGLKAHKNPTEVAQMQAANLKASRAKTRALKWIADQLQIQQPLTELDVSHAISRFYADEEGFMGLSFNTIAATGANGSIVHYGTPSDRAVLQPGDLLLIDSGAQYLGGTTDDTRAVAIGAPTADQIQRYTEVLKAHINCAMQRFPKGTAGIQLDGITRAQMWQEGLDFGHGTGHGVGAFLNVHEGPNGISKRAQEPLEPGMINSIEPGYYEPNWGGIRLENLYVVRDYTAETPISHGTPTKQWYGFESLTYIPFDRALIDWDRLSDRQKAWLQDYYVALQAKLAPTLDESERQWLADQCRVGPR
jgi:Xaa-Pro aminopeptidase